MPLVDKEPTTHFPECWRYKSHHACCVAEVERLRLALSQETDRAVGFLAKLGWAEQQLHDEQIRCFEWEKMYNQVVGTGYADDDKE